MRKIKEWLKRARRDSRRLVPVAVAFGIGFTVGLMVAAKVSAPATQVRL